MSRALLDLSLENLLSPILQLKTNPNKAHEVFSSNVIKRLYDAKILTKSNEADKLKIKALVLNNRYNTLNNNITILSTLDCNFSCKYCFANKGDFYLKENTEDGIINYIKQFIKRSGDSSFNITWMGGEPLLNYDRIVGISRKLLEITSNFSADIITNGSLITDSISKQLIAINIKYVQVTLDGTESENNATRIFRDGKGTFNEINNGISSFLKYNKNDEHIGLNIRVNLSKKDAPHEIFAKTYRYIKNKYPYSNVFITPGFIESIDENGSCSANFFTKSEIVNFYKILVEMYGMYEYSLYPKGINSECAVRSPSSFTIGPNGELYNCWDSIGKSNAVFGQLKQEGTISIINEELLYKYTTGADHITNAKCLECEVLPICTGGCPEKRIRNHYSNAQFDNCSIYKNHLLEIIETHVISKQIKEYKDC